jgi:hypothetical protein
MKKLIIFLVLLLAGQAWGAEYYLRVDGTAANKEAAIGPGSTQANCMNIAVHNGETFSSGDIIHIADDGGDFTTALTAPTSGVTYINELGDTPVIDIAGVTSKCFAAVDKTNLIIDGVTALDGAFQVFAFTGTTSDYIIRNSTISAATAATCFQLQEAGTITNNTITASVLADVVSFMLFGSSGDMEWSDNNFIIQHSNNVLTIASDTNYYVLRNTFTLNASTPTSVLTTGIASTGILNFKNNTITATVPTTSRLINVGSGVLDIDMSGNTITVPATQTQTILRIQNQPAPEIYSNTINSLGDSEIIIVESSGTASGVSQVRTNTITSASTTKHGILVGSETTGGGNGDFDGAVIENNNVTMGGTGGASHAIFFGFSADAEIEKNITKDAFFGFVIKGSNTAWSSGGVRYNLAHNVDYGLYAKGVQGVNFTNNTIVTEAQDAYFSTLNTGGDQSTDNILKNNILVNLNSEKLVHLISYSDITDPGDQSDLHPSNNCYWSGDVSNTSFIVDDYNGGAAMTFAEYVIGGRAVDGGNNSAFEEGSICADPLFIDAANGNFRLNPKSPCINAGTNSVVSVGDTDLDGRLVVVPTEIGAYQFYGIGPIPESNIYIPPNWYLPSNLYEPDNLYTP